MKKILYLNGSMTGKSKHMVVSRIKELKKEGEDISLEIIDLNDELSQSLLTSNSLTNGEFFNDSKKWIDKISEPDEIIISSGLINFHLSPIVMNFINKIVVSGVTFKYTAEGRVAPLEDVFKKIKVHLLITSGSHQHQLPEFVHNVPHVFASSLKFIGFKDVEISWLDGFDAPELFDKELDEKYHILKEKIKF